MASKYLNENTLEFNELIAALMDDTISDQQYCLLNDRLARDPDAVEYYVEFLTSCAALKKCYHVDLPLQASPSDSSEGTDSSPRANDLVNGMAINLAKDATPWQTIARTTTIREMARDALDQFKKEERIRQTELAYQAYVVRRRQLIVGIGSFAALVAIFLFAWLAPKLKSEMELESERLAIKPVLIQAAPRVARIVNSVHAQWRQHDMPTRPGTRLTASSLFLQQGLVKIMFDDGAKVILQAPCDFQLETTARMRLNRGMLSASVPVRAIGFAVDTPNGRVTDLGTRFGVLTRENGDVEAHVYQGKVSLQSTTDVQYELTEGQAGRINQLGQVTNTDYHPDQIIRKLPDGQGFGVPGKRLSLADVVGGGNGYGTGRLGNAIDVLTGQLVQDFYEPIGSDRFKRTETREAYPYSQVPSLEYIDGVFIPYSASGQISVSSKDHVFTLDSVPLNSGYRRGIGYWPLPQFHEQGRNAILDGQEYGALQHPAIMMKRNKGITFDLDAIRRDLSGISIESFSALCGLTSIRMPKSREMQASFYVLLDGRECFRRIALSPESRGISVHVEIGPQDRFLTLISAFTNFVSGVGNHFVVAEPSLELGSMQTPPIK
jgi:hypothetical protein